MATAKQLLGFLLLPRSQQLLRAQHVLQQRQIAARQPFAAAVIPSCEASSEGSLTSSIVSINAILS
jgi:hypothetical protein